MLYWLQSLSENGFDVFTLVYIAVLILINHYMLRWYIRLLHDKAEKKMREYLHYTIYKIEK